MMNAVKMLVGVAVACLAAGCLSCGGRANLPSGFVHVTERVPDAILEIRYHSTYNFVGKCIDGYLAAKSGHSRGSTVDLTLVEAVTGREADMGGSFDCFGRRSHSDFTEGLTSVQITNRRILREAMVAAGFEPLAEEWWHFTLKDEPYPDRYFDFPVRSLTAR